MRALLVTAPVDHAASGRLQIDVERVPLAEAPAAWLRQASGGAPKLVLVP